MTKSDSTSYLTRANHQFRSGNYKESIVLYNEAIKHESRLAESISANILIAEKRMTRLPLQAVSDNDSGLENAVLAPIGDEKLLQTTPTLASTAAVTGEDNVVDAPSSDRPVTSLSLDEIFSIKLDGPLKRLLKEYDDDLEAHFCSKVMATKKLMGSKSEATFVSIIMPTYNRAKTIEKAVNSVISQTHSNWELIIIDDGSTDNTLQILEQYKDDSRVKLLNGGHNGVSAARNIGLAQVAGDYIYYLDSDNTWTQQYLEIMNLAFLHTRKMTGYASITLQDEHDHVLGYRGEPFDWAQCLEANFIDINTFAHHKSLLEMHGPFDVSLRRMVDWDLILRYTRESTPFFAPFVGCLYLESRNDASRITLSEPLAFQKVVRLKNSLENNAALNISKSLSLKFAIKIPAPFEERQQWGDYHYADSLRIALEAMGHTVAMDFHGAWYTRPPSADDVVIVIRGLTAYNPRKGAINIIWNISHPDQVSADEFEGYDMAYVASASYAYLLGMYVKTKVFPLIQCSDPERFHYQGPTAQQSKAMLFVGNSRNEYRPIVKKAVEAGKDIAIYGTRWSKLVDNKYIYGENIPNTELCKQYASYGMVLNDHWESMREFGYVSNRVFDVLASGGTLVSDPVPSISRLFGDVVIQLEEHAGFETVNRQIAEIDEAGETRKQIISEFVNFHHSFTNRARVICDDVLARLGLPVIWSDDLRVDAGDCSFENGTDVRHTIGLIIEKDNTVSGHSAFRRLISPLTTDAAHIRSHTVIIDGVDDPLLMKCHSIIVQGVAIKNTDEAHRLIDITTRANIPLYLDVYQSHMGKAADDLDAGSAAEAMLLIMHSAAHVWFATNRLALSYCYAYRSASVIVDSLDTRFWRNYRKPEPRAALAPKYRMLYLASPGNADDLGVVLPALDQLFSERGAVFELIILGEMQEIPEKSWIKYIQPTSRRSLYPMYANWLINAEKFDIGIAPVASSELNSTSSDYNFLHYTALGIPTLCSRTIAFSELNEKGLVLASENSAHQWFRAFSLAFDSRELMLDMVDRAWKYSWKHRSAASAGNKILHTIDTNVAKPKAATSLPKIAAKSIAVCIHLYYIEQWPKLKSYLDRIDKEFDLFVTCTADNQLEVEQLVKADYQHSIIVGADNHGMDVLPFLLINHDYELWRYSAVLKLHTKNTKTPDDQIFGNICYESLLSSSELVDRIVNKIWDEFYVGLIGPEVLYRSASSLMYVNASGVRDIFETLDVDYPKTDWGFFAGTMFWIRGNLLHGLAANFEQINRLALLDSRVAKSGGDGTWAHAMERIFGALPVLQGMYSAATYVESPSKNDWGIRSIPVGEFTKSLSFRVSSKWHTARYANLEKWADLCLNSDLFDSDYYLEHSGGVIPANMAPIAHYILYGDDLALNPSSGFSTAYYKIKHSDVIPARIPMLVHYLVHGKREGRMITAVADY